MMKLVTTETGRKYLLDLEGSFWWRLPKMKDGYVGGPERIWSLQHGTHFNFPWNSPEGTWTDGAPVVGEYMFISGKSVWYTSTLVVSIEEVGNDYRQDF